MPSNPYAAGANVYRGGSNVATMGKVDPTGYVNRELNNRRSQLAQGMLQKLGGNQQQTQQPQQQQQRQMPSFMQPIEPKHVSLLAVRMLGGGT